MPDYSNGKIYTIRCRTDDTLIYVGSTCQSLSNRFCGHKKDSTTSLYKKVNNDWDNWYIELYELFPCDNKEELNKRESEITRLLGTINRRIEGRTQKEYYTENKQVINENKKKYYEKNKNKFSELSKQYHEEHKERMNEYYKQYREENKGKKAETDKQYYEANKEKIAEYHKQWREQNKEAISEQRKEKTVCNCGCEIRKSDLNRHMKTKKHLDLIQSVN